MVVVPTSELLRDTRIPTVYTESIPMQPRRTITPRDRRLKHPQPFALQSRDLDILHALHTYRFLTAPQITSLFFGSKKRAYARLHKLYHHRLINRHFLGMYVDKMNTPMVCVLDKAGAELLRTERGFNIRWYKSITAKPLATLFLRHALEVNDVRIAVERACQQQGTTLLKWLSEYDLKTNYDRVTIADEVSRAVIPDGYCALKTKQGITHLFWEIDRGTERSAVFKHKILAYLAYAKSDLALKRFGTQQFRVLTVTKTLQRATNLRAATEKVQGKSRFWFATLTDVTPEKVLTEPIWSVAGREETAALLY